MISKIPSELIDYFYKNIFSVLDGSIPYIDIYIEEKNEYIDMCKYIICNSLISENSTYFFYERNTNKKWLEFSIEEILKIIENPKEDITTHIVFSSFFNIEDIGAFFVKPMIILTFCPGTTWTLKSTEHFLNFFNTISFKYPSISVDLDSNRGCYFAIESIYKFNSFFNKKSINIPIDNYQKTYITDFFNKNNNKKCELTLDFQDEEAFIKCTRSILLNSKINPKLKFYPKDMIYMERHTINEIIEIVSNSNKNESHFIEFDIFYGVEKIGILFKKPNLHISFLPDQNWTFEIIEKFLSVLYKLNKDYNALIKLDPKNTLCSVEDINEFNDFFNSLLLS